LAVAAALIATPALARTARTKTPAAVTHSAPASFHGSYAAADRAPAGGIVVAPDGRVVGADPDPSIRLELARDAWVSAY
jgi:hypothetical protein